MNTKVRSAVLTRPGKIEIREFDMPSLEQGGAIAKVRLAGICGTDKHSFRGESVQYKGTKNETDLPFPIIQGHENVIEIVEISSEGAKNLEFDGRELKPGMRVTMCPDVTCGKCWYCKNMPSYPWCEKLQFSYGNMRSCDSGHHLYGGFSEYIYIEPGTRLYAVPDGLPDEVAVLTEIMCVAYSLDKAKEFNSFSLEGFNFDDTIVIQGVGPLGLAHLIKARMMGAGKIIATDISTYRLDIARAFGADICLNAAETTEKERIERVREETGGRGADIVCECVGKPMVVSEGLRMLRKAGMYLETGNFVDCGSIPINVHEICANALRVVGMVNHTHNSYRQMMDMMLRSLDRFPWPKFVSHVYPLGKTCEALYKSMTLDCMKVAIRPNA